MKLSYNDPVNNFDNIEEILTNGSQITQVAGTVTANTSFNPFQIDASGRQRVSQMTTLLTGKLLGEDDLQLFQNVGTGTATYGSNKVNLAVTSGQYEIRQSKRFNPYFDGKSQLMEFTFDNFQTESNTTKRVGYFSSNAVAPYDSNFDGFFIEDNGTIKSLKAYRNGTLTIDVPFTSMDNYAAIASQNWSNFNVIAFDFLWLGGTHLRFFVMTANGFELIHTYKYAGTTTDTFILSPNQPVRYEIRSTTGTGSFRYICCQVATEGSINEGGKTLSVVNSTAMTTNNIGTIYALKSIRKQTAFRDVAIQILDIAVGINSTTDSGLIMLFVNPTIAGAATTWTTIGKIEQGAHVAANTITASSGRLIAAVPTSNFAGVTNTMKENFLSFLSSQIDNTLDVYTLAYMPTSTNQNVYGVINIKEF